MPLARQVADGLTTNLKTCRGIKSFGPNRSYPRLQTNRTLEEFPTTSKKSNPSTLLQRRRQAPTRRGTPNTCQEHQDKEPCVTSAKCLVKHRQDDSRTPRFATPLHRMATLPHTPRFNQATRHTWPSMFSCTTLRSAGIRPHSVMAAAPGWTLTTAHTRLNTASTHLPRGEHSPKISHHPERDQTAPKHPLSHTLPEAANSRPLPSPRHGRPSLPAQENHTEGSSRYY